MKIKSLLFITILSVLLLPSISCNELENLTNSGSKLVLWDITGEDSEGNATTIILSDVMLNGSVFNDNATANFTAVLLDPTKTSGADSTFYQDIVIDQIDISYTRSDGLNIEGVDVPYSFSQQAHFQVECGELAPSALSFILIQHNAKIESPLVELVNLGQEHILKLEATITFHGKDVAGNRVEPATGHISVWCSNFADPE